MSDKLNEAKKLVHDLVAAQKDSSTRFKQVEKKLEDLQLANRKLTEHLEQKNYQNVTPTGGDSALSRYRDQDGNLILKTKSYKKQVAGRGSMTFNQEGLLDATVPANDWHAELMHQVEQRTFARLTMAEPYTPKADAKLYAHLMKAPTQIKPSIEKAFNDQAGTGAEFIPDQFLSTLFEPFQQRGNLRSLLQTQQVDRQTILIPRMNRGSRPYIKSQITSNDPALYQASDIQSAQKTISIDGFASRIIIDDSASEDSAFNVAQMLRNTLSKDLEDAFEDCVINGSPAGTLDTLSSWDLRGRWGSSGLGGASDHRKLFKGFRQLAFDKGTTHDIGSAGQSYLEFADIISMLGKMGEYGVAQHVMIVSPEVMTGGLMQMSQTTTLDKFGPNASILKGQIASVMGMPIIMSRFMGADLAANGKFTGAGATSGALIVAMDSYYEYLRRGITVETSKDISSGGIEIVATMRSVMDSPDAADKKNVAYGFNHS